MKNKTIFSLLLFTSFLFFNCRNSKLLSVTKRQSVFIVKKDDNLQNELKRLVMNASLPNKCDTIFIEAGEYNINETIYKGVINSDIVIKGIGEVRLNVKKNVFYFMSPVIYNEKTTSVINRGDKFINSDHGLNNKLNLENLRLLLFSSDYVEEGWKYKKGEIQHIIDFNKKGIQIQDSVMFNYCLNEKANIIIYESKNITLANITFIVNSDKSWDYDQVVRTDGCRVNAYSIKVVNGLEEKKGLFWGMYYCTDIKVKNFSIKNFEYGIGLDYCKNIRIDSVNSVNTHHAIVPACFTQNVYVNHVRGKNTTIDGHPSINLHYNDVNVYTDMDYFNCRSLGVKITNSVFTCNPNNEIESIEIGLTSLREEYKYLYNQYDIIFDNVTWLHKVKSFNGIHVNFCRNFIVKNVRTHMVSTGSFIKNVMLDSSNIGYFKGYDSNFTIQNTKFDKNLANSAKIRYPLFSSFDGQANIINCTFTNYDYELFEFISSPDTKITIKNSDLGTLTGLVKKFEYPNNQYKFLKILKTRNNLKSIPQQFQEAMKIKDNFTETTLRDQKR